MIEFGIFVMFISVWCLIASWTVALTCKYFGYQYVPLGIILLGFLTGLLAFIVGVNS